MSRIADRKTRIDLLLKMINEAGDVPIKAILAKFCIKTGVTPFTAKRYLQLLVDAGEVDESVAEDYL